jgi:hypothetical protein
MFLRILPLILSALLLACHAAAALEEATFDQ